jgi:hypothetical protein
MAEDAVQKYLTDIGEIYRTGGGVDGEEFWQVEKRIGPYFLLSNVRGLK